MLLYLTDMRKVVEKVLQNVFSAPTFHHIFNCLYILATLLPPLFNNVIFL